MCFFLHDMEELYKRGRDGNNGSIAKAFRDSKNLFVNIIYWDRAITCAFQHSLLESSLKSIEKKSKLKNG